MSTYEVTRTVWLPRPLLATLILLYLAAPCGAQLGGTWEIAGDVCCDYDDGTSDCSSAAILITVAQNGNQLTGSLVLPEVIPLECTVTCTPTTPNCGERFDLAGTVSGTAVTVTVASSQTLSADCGMCTFLDRTSTVVHLQGTVSGRTITGSMTQEIRDTCSLTGDPACEDAIECIGSTCSGTFQVAINGAQLPTPTPAPILPSPTPRPCVGDCNGDGSVTVDELLTMVNIALGNSDAGGCLAGDANGDSAMTIDEVLTAVNNALNGC